MKRSMICLLAAVPLVILAVCWFSHPVPAKADIPAGSEAERLAWLASQGLSCVPVAEAPVTIPADVRSVPADYAALQETLGLPFASHAGEDGMLYTYYTEGSDPPFYAELLTADGVLVGAQGYHPYDGITRDLQGASAG